MAVKVHHADVKCETKHMTDFAALEEGKLQLKGKRDTIIQMFEKKYRITKSGEKQPITTLYVTLQSFQYHQVTRVAFLVLKSDIYENHSQE